MAEKCLEKYTNLCTKFFEGSALTFRHLGFKVGEHCVEEAHAHVGLPMLGAGLRKIVHGILSEKQLIVNCYFKTVRYR